MTELPDARGVAIAPGDSVWVLFRTDGEGEGVVLCGTVYKLSDAVRWSDSGEAKGAINVPLNGLAKGETW